MRPHSFLDIGLYQMAENSVYNKSIIYCYEYHKNLEQVKKKKKK